VDATGAVRKGVVIRWVDGLTELNDLSAGQRAALSKQIAKFRPVQVLLGQYDVHMRNWMVDEAGHVWSIDYGMSVLKNPDQMDALDFMQVTRDMYRERKAVARMDELLRYEDMADIANKADVLGGAKLKQLVLQDLPEIEATEGPKILESLKARQRGLRDALDKWEKMSPKPALPDQTGWVVPLPQPQRWDAELPLRKAA
jgi:hypothetical protein